MAGDVAIKVENVSKVFRLPQDKQNSLKGKLVHPLSRHGYEEQKALENVSFEIKKGEFFGIVGRNGSGKSTLLKLLAGIYTPTEGNIQVNGKLTPFIELGVGFNVELSGRENVFLNGALLGFNRKEMEAMYDDIVEFAEIERFMDQKLKNYSSGMQVRLAFSIAVRVDTDILVLDEVLAVGDEAFQRKCEDYFDSVKKQGKTIILVTHAMDSVRKYCNRALMITNGKIEMIGSPEDVANQYSMENTQAGQIDNPSVDNKTISNIKVTLLSPNIVSEKDTVRMQVEYTIDKKIDTKIYINLVDMNRNVSLYAASTDVAMTKSSYVKRFLSIKLSGINDTNIQTIVSIRNKNGDVIAFLPENTLPRFLLRRSDYPNPRKRQTYAVLFSRGEWSNEK